MSTYHIGYIIKPLQFQIFRFFFLGGIIYSKIDIHNWIIYSKFFFYKKIFNMDLICQIR